MGHNFHETSFKGEIEVCSSILGPFRLSGGHRRENFYSGGNVFIYLFNANYTIGGIVIYTKDTTNFIGGIILTLWRLLFHQNFKNSKEDIYFLRWK